MFTYLDEQFISEMFFDSSKDISYVLFALHSLDRMKVKHLDLLLNNDETIDDFLESMKDFYAENGQNIPFAKSKEDITAEDVIKPYLEKMFMDLYQVAVVKDINWKYKFINYNQLLSVAETAKTFNFGIDKIKISSEFRKEFGSITILTSYAYWIIWSIFNATKMWASKVIPSKVLFEVNTYDSDCLPANLCTLPFRTIIELANNISKTNEKEINDFAKKYPSDKFNSIITFAKKAASSPIYLEPTYYMDDVKNSVNHGIVSTLKAKFKKSSRKLSELLPYIAAQSFTLYINGIFIQESLFPSYKSLPWQKSKAAKKSIYENILNCFYFQDLFDLVASYFKADYWKEIDKTPRDKIIEFFKNSTEDINKYFQGPLVAKWIEEVAYFASSQIFYESNAGLLSSPKGIGSIFVSSDASYKEHQYLSENSLIVEDRLSRIYNMMQALISGVTEYRGFTALRQTSLSAHAIRCVTTFIEIIKGTLYSFNDYLISKNLNIEFDETKLLDMILDTFIEEKIIVAAYKEEYIGKLSMHKLLELALKLTKNYIMLEIEKPINSQYNKVILKALKVKQSNLADFFKSDMFLILSAFGNVIYKIKSALTSDEIDLLKHYNLDRFFKTESFNEYLTPEITALIIEKRKSSIVGIYSFVNNLILKQFFAAFIESFVPIHLEVKDPVLIKKQNSLLNTEIKPTFTILGQVEGEFSHRIIEEIITTTDSFISYLKRCFNYTFDLFNDKKLQSKLKQVNVIDLGFKNRLDGLPLLNKLPKFNSNKQKNLTKEQVIVKISFQAHNKAIEKFNKEQIALLSDYKKEIPPVIYLGYNTNNGAILTKPIIILPALGNYQDITDLIAEINNYNNEQEELLYSDIRKLPKIEDLGFRHSIDGLKIKYPLPVSKNYDIKSLADIVAVKEKIALFNKEQKLILESYKNNFPRIINYGFKNAYAGEFIDTNKALSKFDILFSNYEEYKMAIKKVTNWNDYQDEILSEYVNNLPPVKNYGFETYHNGNPIKYRLSHNYANLGIKNNAKMDSKYFYELNKEILQYSQEQQNILEEYITALPKINDLGFKKRFNLEPLIYSKPLNLDEMKPKLTSRIAIAKYHSDITNFNDEQYNQLQKAIKNLEIITNLNFESTLDGKKLEIFKPVLMPQNINNVSDLEDLATNIHKWNIIQTEILESCLKVVPEIKDLGFRKDSQIINSALDLPIFEKLETQIKSIRDFELICNTINDFNEDQDKSLEYAKFILPKPLLLGFDQTDGAQVPVPEHNYQDLVINYESFIKMSDYINAYNDEQKTILNHAIASLPAISKTHFEYDQKNLPIKNRIPVFVSSDIKSKDDYLDQLRWINLYNEEQASIEANIKHILPAISPHRFKKYPDGTSLTALYPELDFKNTKNGSYSYEDAVSQIKAYNDEQEIIFKSWLNKVPKLIDLGFSSDDGIDISKPIIDSVHNFDNEDLFLELIDAINDWNLLQEKCRELAIKQIPEVLDVDILKDNKSYSRKISRPSVEFYINNILSTKQDFINLIHDVKAFNSEQQEIMIDFIKKYVSKNLFNAGASTYLDSTALKHPLPAISYSDLKSNKDINKYLEDVFEFSKEQRAILKEYVKNIIPAVNDLGFRFAQEVGEKINEENIYSNLENIRNIRNAEFMAKEIRRFNSWQSSILANNIKLLETIESKGFVQKVNGSALIHEMPNPDPYSIKNDEDYKMVAELIRCYNQEQSECLEQLKQSIPLIEDYKIYDSEKGIEKPKLQHEVSLKTQDEVLNYIEYVNDWNRKQHQLLKKKFS